MSEKTKLRAIIVDDEPDAIEVLEGLVQEYAHDVEVIGTALSIEGGLKLIHELQPDLLFLDVQMPRGTGFDLLRQVSSPSFQTIFVSAHPSHAVEAVKFHAMAYLLKPVSSLLLMEAIDLVKDAMEQNTSMDYQALLNTIEQSASSRIAIPTGSGYRYFTTQEIIRIEASKSYSLVFTADAPKPILVSRNLKQFDNLLTKKGFIRAHNTHLVNRDHIREFMRQDGGTLILSDGFSIRVGRSYREAVIDALNNNIASI